MWAWSPPLKQVSLSACRAAAQSCSRVSAWRMTPQSVLLQPGPDLQMVFLRALIFSCELRTQL